MPANAVPESFPAFVATRGVDADGKPIVTRGLSQLAAADLPAGEVTVRVEWSSVNYKDALATLADGAVARISPLVPGIDLAGEVVEATDGSFAVGQKVIAHGYDIGTARHGAYAHYARLLSTQLLPLPDGLSPRESMAIGTAGFTAAQSVHALEVHGIKPGTGPVVVTGATGGVGSAAVGILARRGYEVWASTGKVTEAELLKGLGATEVIDREELATDSGRPLDKERWAAAVDCVGGQTLATIVKSMRHSGAVAASGLTGGTNLPVTVFPFILRNVALLGIDSVGISQALRAEIWARCATDLRPHGIDDADRKLGLITEIGLDGLEGALTAVRAGGAKGRFIVKL